MMSAWDDGDAGTFDLASDLVAAGGVASGLTRKGDDAEEIGGAVFGVGAAVDHPWSAVDEGTDTRGDEEESGGAEGHSCSCDAEALLPGVDVSVTKGMLWGDGLCDVSGNAWVTWNWVPKLILCDSLPEGRPRFLDAIIQQITSAGDVARSYVVRRQVDPGVEVGATKGWSGCRWKVQVVWMVEEEVARMQIEEVNTDVTDDESANLGFEDDCVLGGSY